MYKIGDMIVYGSTGVCRVLDITTPSFATEKDRLYYELSPLYQVGTIYIPIDTNVYMRPVISREEAEHLIDMIPQLHGEAYYTTRLQELIGHYEDALRTHDCSKLIELSMSLYVKKQELESKKRKLGQIDLRFLKRAEDLLFGEMSVALDISKEEVPTYIETRVKSAGMEK